MSTLENLSERLRDLRLRHGLTQEQFAEVAGLGYKFYQQIEAGRKKQIWLETVERLAAAYGVEAWELIGPKEPPHTVLAPAPRASRRPRRRSRRFATTTSSRSQLAAAEDAAAYGQKRRRARSDRRGRAAGKGRRAKGRN